MARSFIIPRNKSLLQRLRMGSKPRHPLVTEAMIHQWCLRIEDNHPLFDISAPPHYRDIRANDVDGDLAEPLHTEAPAVRASRG